MAATIASAVKSVATIASANMNEEIVITGLLGKVIIAAVVLMFAWVAKQAMKENIIIKIIVFVGIVGAILGTLDLLPQFDENMNIVGTGKSITIEGTILSKTPSP